MDNAVGGRPWSALVVVAVAVAVVMWLWRASPAEGVLFTMNMGAAGPVQAGPTDSLPAWAANPAPPARPAVQPVVTRPARRVVAAAGVPALMLVRPSRHDWVAVPAVGLGVSIGDYRDCSGKEPLTRSEGARYDCSPSDVLVLVGHNPGVFTPLVRAHEGEEVQYWDQVGSESTYVVSAIHRLSRSDAGKYPVDDSFRHLVLITCAVPDGSEDWVIVATPT